MCLGEYLEIGCLFAHLQCLCQAKWPGQLLSIAKQLKGMGVMFFFSSICGKERIWMWSYCFSLPVPSFLSVQEQGVAGMSRPPGAIPPSHTAGGVASGMGPNQGSGPPPGYVGNQQQAAMMKQMMAMEQEKRVQMHMMEQQKQQLFREQRQQQQQLLAEQVSLLLVHS